MNEFINDRRSHAHETLSQEEKQKRYKTYVEQITIDFIQWKNLPITNKLINHLEKLREEIIRDMSLYAFKNDREMNYQSICASYIGKLQIVNDLLYNDFSYLLSDSTTDIKGDENDK